MSNKGNGPSTLTFFKPLKKFCIGYGQCSRLSGLLGWGLWINLGNIGSASKTTMQSPTLNNLCGPNGGSDCTLSEVYEIDHLLYDQDHCLRTRVEAPTEAGGNPS